jgi:hypothetical protein
MLTCYVLSGIIIMMPIVIVIAGAVIVHVALNMHNM